MSVDPNKVEVGDILYAVTSEKAGNTTARRQRVDKYRVAEIMVSPPWRTFRLAGMRNPIVSGFKLRQMSRNPPEWIKGDPFRERTCYLCRASESQGHDKDCEHPAAERARKKAAKKETP